ncbi:hypothetical protein [Sphingomonas mali]|uniref:hypothetical protein n=1 Tax=Sphingomonas mali TaxID=40682 RepID=UPI000834D89B|nr:hypothetical protein [Sphingomonas mali]
MQPVATLIIDNRNTDLADLAVPEMSLSSARATMVPHEFSLSLKTACAIEILAPKYDRLVDELRKDDEVTGCAYDALAKTGYPAFELITQNEEALLVVLGHHLRDELFAAFSGDRKAPTYWLDAVTKCESDGLNIRIHGVCYSEA